MRRCISGHGPGSTLDRLRQFVGHMHGTTFDDRMTGRRENFVHGESRSPKWNLIRAWTWSRFFDLVVHAIGVQNAFNSIPISTKCGQPVCSKCSSILVRGSANYITVRSTALDVHSRPHASRTHNTGPQCSVSQESNQIRLGTQKPPRRPNRQEHSNDILETLNSNTSIHRISRRRIRRPSHVPRLSRHSTRRQ